jgi:hypothetical protein
MKAALSGPKNDARLLVRLHLEEITLSDCGKANFFPNLSKDNQQIKIGELT